MDRPSDREEPRGCDPPYGTTRCSATQLRLPAQRVSETVSDGSDLVEPTRTSRRATGPHLPLDNLRPSSRSDEEAQRTASLAG